MNKSGKEKRNNIINFQGENCSGAIGIIYGADNPNKEEAIRKQNDFYDYAAKIIKPCERRFEEIEEYLIEQYGAVEYMPNERELSNFKVNVILNKFDHVIKRTVVIDENSLIEDLIKSRIEDRPSEQARNYPASKLGLKMKFYKVKINKNSTDNKFVIVRIEKTSEYIDFTHEFEDDIDLGFIDLELLAFTGVSQKDIDEKNVRFKMYASLLKGMGKI